MLTSPRVRVGDLDRLVERLWDRPGAADWPIVVTRGELPPTHRAVEVYAVAGTAGHPRYLLPLGARPAVREALTTHLSTHSLGSRLGAGAAAAGWQTGALQRFLRTRLVVGVDRRVPDHRLGDWLLFKHLADELGVDDLCAVIPVRRAMPNTKPTARLSRRSDGAMLGYLKVGWSNPTAALVANETAVLTELDGRAGAIGTPRVASSGNWHDLNYLVSTPLPPRLGSFPFAPESTPELMAGIVGSSATYTWDVATSPYVEAMRRCITAAYLAQPLEATRLRRRLEQIVGGHGERLRFGRWHGDWVPWNAGRTAQQDVVAWDWEYSAAQVPVGFDLAHWHFQTTLARTGGLAEAVAAVHRASPGLAALGVPSERCGLVADLYVVEILARALTLASQGAGWNPRIHPAMLHLFR